MPALGPQGASCQYKEAAEKTGGGEGGSTFRGLRRDQLHSSPVPMGPKEVPTPPKSAPRTSSSLGHQATKASQPWPSSYKLLPP